MINISQNQKQKLKRNTHLAKKREIDTKLVTRTPTSEKTNLDEASVVETSVTGIPVSEQPSTENIGMDEKKKETRELISSISNSTKKIVINLHYVLEHSEEGTPRDTLLKGILVEGCSNSHLYRLYNLALLEYNLTVLPNTLCESWVREISRTFKSLDDQKKVWQKATQLVENETEIKIEIQLIKMAIEYIIDENKTAKATKQLCENIKNNIIGQEYDSSIFKGVLNCNNDTKALLLKILSIKLPTEECHKNMVREIETALG